MNHTPNLNLPQWEASDFIRRTDFNDAMSNIDTGVAGKADNATVSAQITALQNAMPKIAVGSYVGTGSSGINSPNSLTFNFVPKMLLVLPKSNDWVTTAQLLAIKDVTCIRNTFDGGSNAEYHTNLIWNGNTVSWYSASAAGQFNYNGSTYYYCVIG